MDKRVFEEQIVRIKKMSIEKLIEYRNTNKKFINYFIENRLAYYDTFIELDKITFNEIRKRKLNNINEGNNFGGG